MIRCNFAFYRSSILRSFILHDASKYRGALGACTGQHLCVRWQGQQAEGRRCTKEKGGDLKGGALRCSQMLLNAVRCSQMLSNAVRCSQMLSDALRCCQMLSDALKCFHMLSHALRCPQILSDPSKCSQMLSYALRCSQMLSDALKCSQMLSDALRCSHDKPSIGGQNVLSSKAGRGHITSLTLLCACGKTEGK